MLYNIAHLSLQDCVSTKANLENYDGSTESREHIQNMRSILERVTQYNDVMCKVLSTTLREFTCSW